MGARVRKQAEIWDTLKIFSRDKTPGIDGLLWGVFDAVSLRVSLVVRVFNQWMKNGNIPERFTRDVIKLLRNNKHGIAGINNFWSLSMLNNELRILTKVLDNSFQAVFPSLIGPEQTSTVKGIPVKPRWSI